MNPITLFLVFIVLLGPLMLVHELGHFLAAKRAGVRVEEFGMGLPPRAVKLAQRGDTTYSLNWLPFGAFVRMTGENPDDAHDDPRSFSAASKFWRAVIIFAGPLANFLSAVVILFFAYLVLAEQPTAVRYRIDSVRDGSPAQAIGFKQGDVVLSVNGVDMLEKLAGDGAAIEPTHLRDQARASVGKEFTAIVQRKDGAATSEITLKGAIPANADATAPLGVSLGFPVVSSARVNYTVPQAASMAFDDLATMLKGMARLPGDLISGRMTLEQARPVGPVGITMIGASLLQQGLFAFVRFAGILSFLIGLSNLLPIPALDGGRLVFIFIEAIRGRRVDPAREQWVHAVGMIFVLALAVVIVVMDLVKPVVLP
ncbi:MAG TPA: M50 family metallopeptidase [Thermoflexales bacterium]|nr:M50 family metallopeptidase [Thermoflexales bacterium]HQZ21151.1 M50 family metallopeptidase [Thermoflexales bacterium]HRA00695.1 M50 family metallopeptidase [Thermoflexales bacterium]